MKYDELVTLTKKDIDALYEAMGGIQESKSVPIFDVSGGQILDQGYNQRILSFNHVAAVNQWFADLHDLDIDPSSTLSSELKDKAIFLGAVDVYGITNDSKMVLGIRSAFQKVSSVAPRKVFDTASGFRSLVSGSISANPAIRDAVKELEQEMGISIDPSALRLVHEKPNAERLIHFPQVPTNSDESVVGLRPTFSHSYVVDLPFASHDISQFVMLSSEHDGIVLADTDDVLSLWSGETDSISSIIYPSSRLNGVTSGQNLDEIFVNAKLNLVIGDKERVTIGKPIQADYRSTDAMINGSMSSIATKAKLLREFGL